MRKLFLAGVSVFALGVSGAVADEAGTIIQEGTDGAAYIDQAGGASSDNGTALIEQASGSSNDVAAISQRNTGLKEASIKQQAAFSDADVTGSGATGGTDNVAGIVQNEAAGAGGSVARIWQNGSSNKAGIAQRNNNNTAKVAQKHTGNEAMVRQGNFGPNAFANRLSSTKVDTSDAGGLVNPTFDHPDFLLPTGFSLNPSATARNSVAVVDQTGIDNKALVSQEGNLHEARVNQADTTGDQAVVIQTGDSHKGFVDQSAAGDFSIAQIYQSGSGNEGHIEQ